ncbi:uncharacterized protein LOC127734635 [Mytilus californianus]|uniref:uncharacterized protein LOC127734635 n=1 Tax=Mytilus californianus TaxID=6549 RepID=UPI0022483C05|nr:uncharacterized protein LOC127734635 [Mytilus californianus]
MGLCGSKTNEFDNIQPTPKTRNTPPNDTEEDGSDFLYEFENDSDEIQLEPTEEGYPEPKANDDSHKIFQMLFARKGSNDGTDENGNEIINQEQIDNYARNAPADVSSTFEDLIEYLEKPFKNHPDRDAFLVRAILVWLSNQNIDQMAMSPGNSTSPAGYLALLGQKKTTYSTFFTALCRKGGVLCAQIRGICKAGDYQPGDRDERGSLWNAVYLHDNWHIVHPFWACRSVFGKVSGGWIKLEAGGQTIAKRTEESAGTIQNSFDDNYIMPKPKEFLYACHPNDSKWQLVKPQISRNEFLDKAYLLPPFWRFGMEMISEDRCSIISKNGEAKISFKAPLKTGNEIDVWYELLLKENTSGAETDLLNPENIPKLVSMIRNTPEWNCTIQFPAKGLYKIVFSGGRHNQGLARLGEFQLVCNEKIQDCKPLPFNPGRAGIGYGPVTESAGLILPSHRNGQIHVDKTKPTSIRFFVDSIVLKTLIVRTELITNSSVNDKNLQKALNEKVTWKIESSGKEHNMQTSARELKIVTDAQTKENCYLRIYTGHRSRHQDDTIEPEMSVVCNYFLTTSKLPSYENGSKRFARRNLLTAMEGDDMELINKCLLHCERTQLGEDDADMNYARQKIEVLTLRKAIHDARLRKNLGNVELTIKMIKSSKFMNIFLRDIQVLEKFAESLRQLKGFTCDLPRLLDALLELRNRNVPNDVVKNTLTALLVLFGCDVDENEDFEDIQLHCKALAGRLSTQKDSSFKEADARKAQEIMEKYTYEEKQCSTMAAAKLHLWIQDVSKKVLNDFKDDS